MYALPIGHESISGVAHADDKRKCAEEKGFCLQKSSAVPFLDHVLFNLLKDLVAHAFDVPG